MAGYLLSAIVIHTSWLQSEMTIMVVGIDRLHIGYYSFKRECCLSWLTLRWPQRWSSSEQRETNTPTILLILNMTKAEVFGMLVGINSPRLETTSNWTINLKILIMIVYTPYGDDYDLADTIDAFTRLFERD